MADAGKRVSTTGGQFEDEAKIKPRQSWTKTKEWAGWIEKTCVLLHCIMPKFNSTE
jgi:hypothetical protein